MKDQRPQNNKNGVTLTELLMVIALTGLIFAAGIYPMLSQLKLTERERTEIALYDEANLVVDYITMDFLNAEKLWVEIGGGAQPQSTKLKIYQVTDPLNRDNSRIRVEYYWWFQNETVLERIVYDEDTGSLLRRHIVTRHLAGMPVFNASGFSSNKVICDLAFAQDNITTTRNFTVMARCKDRFYTP